MTARPVREPGVSSLLPSEALEASVRQTVPCCHKSHWTAGGSRLPWRQFSRGSDQTSQNRSGKDVLTESSSGRTLARTCDLEKKIVARAGRSNGSMGRLGRAVLGGVVLAVSDFTPTGPTISVS